MPISSNVRPPKHTMGSATRYRHRFLAAHPKCAFCGGVLQATTIEHCPPRAMFQNRQWPEGFEFPSCDSCNQGSDDEDLLVAMLARMDPFEEKGNEDGRLQGLMLSANKQYPGLFQKMMPSVSEARRNNREFGTTPMPGKTHQDTGVVKVPEELHVAVCTLAKKLAKGVFYRDAGTIFPNTGCLLLNWFTNADLIRDGKYVVFDLLKELGGTAPPTQRSGKYLGDQFEYKMTLAPEGTVFILQARFGSAFGLAVFGSITPGLLEDNVLRLREQTSSEGPFAVLQSAVI